MLTSDSKMIYPYTGKIKWTRGKCKFRGSFLMAGSERLIVETMLAQEVKKGQIVGPPFMHANLVASARTFDVQQPRWRTHRPQLYKLCVIKWTLEALLKNKIMYWGYGKVLWKTFRFYATVSGARVWGNWTSEGDYVKQGPTLILKVST